MLSIQAEHLVGNFALRYALVDEFDRVGHHGVVGGRRCTHEFLLSGILVGARGGDGKVAQEKLACGVALQKGHQKPERMTVSMPSGLVGSISRAMASATTSVSVW